MRLCECGCGKITPIAYETRPKRGWVKGQPAPYYPHHRKNRWPVSDGTTKRCRECQEAKPIEQFHRNRRNADGRQFVCKPCSKARLYRYKVTAGGQVRILLTRIKGRLEKYRITQAQYDAMCKAQDWRCAICRKPETSTFRGKPRMLAIDHCHDTGKVRGLLCAHCNQAIGKLDHDPELIRKAADYVERNR